MISHYHWCANAKTTANRLARYEGFWKEHYPTEEFGYEDAPHIYYIRRAAYRLAALYAQTGQVKKCQAMLKWLELHDETLPDNINPPKAAR
jgi:hypothetical protein